MPLGSLQGISGRFSRKLGTYLSANRERLKGIIAAPQTRQEDKLPSLSRTVGFQPDQEEAEQDAPPPSHASSVARNERAYLLPL